MSNYSKESANRAPGVPGNNSENVAEFGYKQAMKRGTGKFASFAVAFAFVSIATGIFTT
jgi:hypothetical protein